MRYIYPTATRAVSDDYAAHVARGSVNPGTDYMAPYGSAVVAVAGGRVVGADPNPTGSGGRLVYIDHDDGSKTDYLHLSQILVTRGQHVDQGQRIALSGASGYGQDRYYGPHLHISLHIGPGAAHGYNGACVDFENYLTTTTAASGAQPITQREDENMKLLHVPNGTVALIGEYTNRRYTSPVGGQGFSIEANKRAYGEVEDGMTEDVVATLGGEADARRKSLVSEIVSEVVAQLKAGK